MNAPIDRRHCHSDDTSSLVQIRWFPSADFDFEPAVEIVGENIAKRETPSPGLRLEILRSPVASSVQNGSDDEGTVGRWPRSIAIVSLLLILLFPWSSRASHFPDVLTIGGDGLQTAPVANFHAEIDRLDLPTPDFKAIIPTNSHGSQTLEGEVTDLRAALSKIGVPASNATPIVDRFQSARFALEIEAIKVKDWEQSLTAPRMTAGSLPRPTITAPAGLPGLPPEFAEYWRASVLWRAGLTNAARTVWRNLLGRPADERRYRSTWATYMLGRSWELDNPAESIRYFREVRKLAANGFTDTIGLAAASIGREARLRLEQEHYAEAIELYLEQLAAGDSSAYLSLRFTAERAMAAPRVSHAQLAADPQCRKVITAYLIAGFYLSPVDSDDPVKESMIRLASKSSYFAGAASGWHTLKAPAVLWLDAVEGAKIRDPQSAEQFALLAYQCQKLELAAQWIKRAKGTPLAQWLQARLSMRDGQLDTAAEQLTKVRRLFPLEISATPLTPRSPFTDSLYADSEREWNPSPGEQILGELGAVQLARRHYEEALDCLLRAGYWRDASYVAERVLTIDELRAYVDRHWPEPEKVQGPSPAAARSRHGERISSARVDLRYLLARRLTRNERGAEARPYFPESVRTKLDEWLGLIRLGHNAAEPGEARAAALWEAARLTKLHGGELLGAEIEPDWAVSMHRYVWGYSFSVMDRATNAWVVAATADELRRAREHGPDPRQRFQYTCTAPALAWEAAQLMPENSDDTALVLNEAGIWIKYCNPEAADYFYKSLVRRCRRTTIGAAADKRRWFPELDDNGNLRNPGETQTQNQTHGQIRSGRPWIKWPTV